MYNAIMEFLKDSECLGSRDEQKKTSRSNSANQKGSRKPTRQNSLNNSKVSTPRNPKKKATFSEASSPRRKKSSSPSNKGSSSFKRSKANSKKSGKSSGNSTHRKESMSPKSKSKSRTPKNKELTDFQIEIQKAERKDVSFEEIDARFEINDKSLKIIGEEPIKIVETPKLVTFQSDFEHYKPGELLFTSRFKANSAEKIKELNEPREENKSEMPVIRIPLETLGNINGPNIEEEQEEDIEFDEEDYKFNDRLTTINDGDFSEANNFTNELGKFTMKQLDKLNSSINKKREFTEYIKFSLTSSWKTSFMSKVKRRIVLTDKSVMTMKGMAKIRKRMFYSEIFCVYFDFSSNIILIVPLKGKKIKFISTQCETVLLFLAKAYKECINMNMPVRFVSSESLNERKKSADVKKYEANELKKITLTLKKELEDLNENLQYREVVIVEKGKKTSGKLVLSKKNIFLLKGNKVSSSILLEEIKGVSFAKLDEVVSLWNEAGDKLEFCCQRAHVIPETIHNILLKNFKNYVSIDYVDKF